MEVVNSDSQSSWDDGIGEFLREKKLLQENETNLDYGMDIF